VSSPIPAAAGLPPSPECAHLPRRLTLRENLESIALAILFVLVVRQLVVEAFKIPTGSMAPTLLGTHKEVRCVNCGWVFRVGYNKLGPAGEVECPNCHHVWPGASERLGDDWNAEEIHFRKPSWLWADGRTVSGKRVAGIDAANRVDRWGTRIFVNKFLYKLRQPRRWEIVVFLYPYAEARCKDCYWSDPLAPADIERCPNPRCGSRHLEILRKNYIKRLIGLPGEEVAIRDGDIYINGHIARKPPAVQDQLWQHVFDSSYVPRQPHFTPWDFGRQPGCWVRNTTDGSLTLDALDSAEPVLAQFGEEIKDFCPYNGPAEAFGSRALHAMDDCRIEALAEVKAASKAGRAVLVIAAGGRVFTAEFPLAAGGDAVIREGGHVLARASVPALQLGRSARICLENYDDFLVAKLDGRSVISVAYDGSSDAGHRGATVSLGAAGAKVAFRRVLIQRDVYYRGQYEDRPYVCRLPPDGYFVLGDNSPESSDSRYWPSPVVPAANMMGVAFATFWPIHDLEWFPSGSK
jgi:signal peptidase I